MAWRYTTGLKPRKLRLHPSRRAYIFANFDTPLMRGNAPRIRVLDMARRVTFLHRKSGPVARSLLRRSRKDKAGKRKYHCGRVNLPEVVYRIPKLRTPREVWEVPSVDLLGPKSDPETDCRRRPSNPPWSSTLGTQVGVTRTHSGGAVGPRC